MEKINDRRATGMPDVPYSAYCQVCWYPIYAVWFTDEEHGGACMYGHKRAENCEEACSRAQFAAKIQKLRDEGLIKSRLNQKSKDGEQHEQSK